MELSNEKIFLKKVFCLNNKIDKKMRMFFGMCVNEGF